MSSKPKGSSKPKAAKGSKGAPSDQISNGASHSSPSNLVQGTPLPARRFKKRYAACAVLVVLAGLSMMGTARRALTQLNLVGPIFGPVPTPSPSVRPSPARPAWLEGTAIVTMASGDHHARLAVALVQSLRDVETRIPNIVVLLPRGGIGSKDCQNDTWRREVKRDTIPCPDAKTAIAAEIISQIYIDTLQRLGAETRVVNAIPTTPFTEGIPGGSVWFWGMAFNKLLIFNMTEFRKILWMDSDTLVLQNVDDLMLEPMFTGGFTYDCCKPGAGAIPSGGLWRVDPSPKAAQMVWDAINHEVPGPDAMYRYWHWGDMMVVRYVFGAPITFSIYGVPWPFVNDKRHGYIPGIRKYFEVYSKMTDEQFNNTVRWNDGEVAPEGFIEDSWDGESPVWRALDVRYDQCIGHCECLPERDIPKEARTVHLSCMHHMRKPAEYDDEHTMMTEIYNYAQSCTRFYLLTWYAAFLRGHGRAWGLPLYTGPKIPVWNSTHDNYVRAKRLADERFT